MNPTVAAFLRSWPSSPGTIAILVATGVIYLRGWQKLVRRGSPQFSTGQLASFVGGLVVLFLALCSPLDEFAGLLLSAHMVQHLLLMFVAPPLLCYGAPQSPLLLGIPAPVLAHWIMPVWQHALVRRIADALTHPAIAWTVAALVLWMWHLPYFYELALSSELWHEIEHACFFWSALWFWWPVLQPYPSRAVWPRAAMLPYLFLASLPATVLCAILTFSDRVLYARYEALPPFGGRSPLVDQAIAGALMWSVGMVAYLLPLVLIGYELLRQSSAYEPAQERVVQPSAARPHSGHAHRSVVVAASVGAEAGTIAFRFSPAATPETVPLDSWSITDTGSVQRPSAGTARRESVSAPRAAQGSPWDLLQIPLLGLLLRSLGLRRLAQGMFFGLALLIMLDGWCGRQFAPLNLAGVLPWIHWRGVVVLTLLLAGNLFCLGCPLMLPRTIGRRFWTPQRAWPTWLRSKWLAVALLVVFFWAYEAFDLWSRPWWTAWIVLGYFLTATAVDMLFEGASFCKYVCPIGQFQFVQSLVSPWQVQARDAQVCATCRTRECIQGSDTARGCELQLFVPRKTSNMDCTFCMDCVRACPASNIGVLAISLAEKPHAHGAAPHDERLLRRPDVAALLLCLSFAAFANAAGMVAPIVGLEQRIARQANLSLWVVETGYLILSLVVLPLVVLWLTANCARRGEGGQQTSGQNIATYAGAMVPLGAAMWLAHYGYHLVVGAAALAPATLRFLGDWGIPCESGAWIVKSCCAAAPPDWLLRAETLILDLGLLAGLYVAFGVARRRHTQLRQVLAACVSWCVLLGCLFSVGLWVLYQPMEMRGTLPNVSIGAGGGK